MEYDHYFALLSSFLKNSRAAVHKASVPTFRVGCIAGAKNGVWFPAMYVPFLIASSQRSGSIPPNTQYTYGLLTAVAKIEKSSLALLPGKTRMEIWAELLLKGSYQSFCRDGVVSGQRKASKLLTCRCHK
jgi:hypothetical protein